LSEYGNKFPNSTPFGAANGHDAILLISDAINKNFKDANSINTYLHKVKDFSGATGTFSSSSDNRFTLPATVKIVTKDGFKKLKQELDPNLDS
jgi:ABC-type branched-subunit amino acid transport system substrate-binding protein